MKAIWNEKTIAESDQTINCEGNQYFPKESINMEYFKPSDTHSHCIWKGEAHYFTVEVDGKQNKDAAWYYPKASAMAKQIEGYVAFWRGVEVSK